MKGRNQNPSGQKEDAEQKTSRATLYQGDSIEVMKTLKTKSVDCVITDPLYDRDLAVDELRRICRGNIIVFCSPENQFFKPDEFMFWVKPLSTKNFSKHIGRFIEMVLILRGGAFNVLHWSQMTGVYDDRLIHPPVHPFEKPLSLIERLVRIYSNPGDVILDPFNGSGTTGEACIRLSRNYIGIEKEHKYCELSRERWARLKQQKFLS
jgi:DNA modification methylase